jgi:hypothetical protein
MPKKKFGTNSKKQQGQERKKAAKKAKREEELRAKEDATWADNDKKLAKKKVKESKMRDKLLEKDRQAELKRQQQVKEEQELSKKDKKNMNKKKKAAMSKYALALKRRKYVQNLLDKKKPVEKQTPVNNLPLERNTNRDPGPTGPTTIDEALDFFEEKKVDRHPEKRRKAAWNAFQARRYDEIKAEYPTLKRSQINERIFKEFQKSPENPMNQVNEESDED